MALLKNKYGRQMQSFELLPLLGVLPGRHIPAAGIAEKDIDGTIVYATPPRGGKHRVFAICTCGRHVPAGRLHQHMKAHKEV